MGKHGYLCHVQQIMADGRLDCLLIWHSQVTIVLPESADADMYTHAVHFSADTDTDTDTHERRASQRLHRQAYPQTKLETERDQILPEQNICSKSTTGTQQPNTTVPFKKHEIANVTCGTNTQS